MIGLAWLAVTVIAATGLIGKREHFFTDTVGGVLVSVGAVLITTTILDAVANRGVMKRHWWRQEVRHGSPTPHVVPRAQHEIR